MARKHSKTFTERELEIMRILWDRGEATVREMQQALPGDRHYNSVLTIVRVLDRKGHITHRQEGRGFVYRAAAPQEESRSKMLSHVIDTVFGGSFESIVLNMVDHGDLTLEQLDEIRRKVRRRALEKKDKGGSK